MGDDAWSVYQERLRLIAEEEACDVEDAHLAAGRRRIKALKDYIKAQMRALSVRNEKNSHGDNAPFVAHPPNVNVNINNYQMPLNYNHTSDTHVAGNMNDVHDNSCIA